MTTPATPSDPKPAVAADGEAIVPVLTFEDQLHQFWQKNQKGVIVLVVVILLGVVAKGGWEYLESQKEKGIEADYAAATTPDKLKAFAAEHSSHSLGGVAKLRLADDAYAAGKSAEAVAGYEDAIATLKTGPLASRAKLGLAMSKLQAGKPEGEVALKQIAADATELKAVRAEAGYHLASLASAAGKADDVRKYSDDLLKLDPNGAWAQRVFMLRAMLPAEPVAPAPAAPTADSAIKLPASGK